MGVRLHGPARFVYHLTVRHAGNAGVRRARSPSSGHLSPSPSRTVLTSPSGINCVSQSSSAATRRLPAFAERPPSAPAALFFTRSTQAAAPHRSPQIHFPKRPSPKAAQTTRLLANPRRIRLAPKFGDGGARVRDFGANPETHLPDWSGLKLDLSKNSFQPLPEAWRGALVAMRAEHRAALISAIS
jgi:hypothetical protein